MTQESARSGLRNAPPLEQQRETLKYTVLPDHNNLVASNQGVMRQTYKPFDDVMALQALDFDTTPPDGSEPGAASDLFVDVLMPEEHPLFYVTNSFTYFADPVFAGIDRITYDGNYPRRLRDGAQGDFAPQTAILAAERQTSGTYEVRQDVVIEPFVEFQQSNQEDCFALRINLPNTRNTNCFWTPSDWIPTEWSGDGIADVTFGDSILGRSGLLYYNFANTIWQDPLELPLASVFGDEIPRLPVRDIYHKSVTWVHGGGATDDPANFTATIEEWNGDHTAFRQRHNFSGLTFPCKYAGLVRFPVNGWGNPNATEDWSADTSPRWEEFSANIGHAYRPIGFNTVPVDDNLLPLNQFVNRQFVLKGYEVNFPLEIRGRTAGEYPSEEDLNSIVSELYAGAFLLYKVRKGSDEFFPLYDDSIAIQAAENLFASSKLVGEQIAVTKTIAQNLPALHLNLNYDMKLIDAAPFTLHVSESGVQQIADESVCYRVAGDDLGPTGESRVVLSAVRTIGAARNCGDQINDNSDYGTPILQGQNLLTEDDPTTLFGLSPIVPAIQQQVGLVATENDNQRIFVRLKTTARGGELLSPDDNLMFVFTNQRLIGTTNFANNPEDEVKDCFIRQGQGAAVNSWQNRLTVLEGHGSVTLYGQYVNDEMPQKYNSTDGHVESFGGAESHPLDSQGGTREQYVGCYFDRRITDVPIGYSQDVYALYLRFGDFQENSTEFQTLRTDPRVQEYTEIRGNESWNSSWIDIESMQIVAPNTLPLVTYTFTLDDQADVDTIPPDPLSWMQLNGVLCDVSPFYLDYDALNSAYDDLTPSEVRQLGNTAVARAGGKTGLTYGLWQSSFNSTRDAGEIVIGARNLEDFRQQTGRVAGDTPDNRSNWEDTVAKYEVFDSFFTVRDATWKPPFMTPARRSSLGDNITDVPMVASARFLERVGMGISNEMRATPWEDTPADILAAKNTNYNLVFGVPGSTIRVDKAIHINMDAESPETVSIDSLDISGGLKTTAYNEICTINLTRDRWNPGATHSVEFASTIKLIDLKYGMSSNASLLSTRLNQSKIENGAMVQGQLRHQIISVVSDNDTMKSTYTSNGVEIHYPSSVHNGDKYGSVWVFKNHLTDGEYRIVKLSHNCTTNTLATEMAAIVTQIQSAFDITTGSDFKFATNVTHEGSGVIRVVFDTSPASLRNFSNKSVGVVPSRVCHDSTDDVMRFITDSSQAGFVVARGGVDYALHSRQELFDYANTLAVSKGTKLEYEALVTSGFASEFSQTMLKILTDPFDRHYSEYSYRGSVDFWMPNLNKGTKTRKETVQRFLFGIGNNSTMSAFSGFAVFANIWRQFMKSAKSGQAANTNFPEIKFVAPQTQIPTARLGHAIPEAATVGSYYATEFLLTIPDGSGPFGAPIIEAGLTGYRYGLSGINPTAPQVVTNPSHFGQPCDLIRVGAIGAIQNSDGKLETRVQTQFVNNASGISVPADQTGLYNKTTNYTSVSPYFDGDPLYLEGLQKYWNGLQGVWYKRAIAKMRANNYPTNVT